MKINELLEGYGSIEQVIQAYKEQHADDIALGCKRDWCGIPATGFKQFAADAGFGKVEAVKGYFKVDKVQYKKADFWPEELKAMRKEGFRSSDREDRIAFAKKHDLEDGLRYIPHQWNELQGQIIDFTGPKQFARLAADTNRERYSYDAPESPFKP